MVMDQFFVEVPAIVTQKKLSWKKKDAPVLPTMVGSESPVHTEASLQLATLPPPPPFQMLFPILRLRASCFSSKVLQSQGVYTGVLITKLLGYEGEGNGLAVWGFSSW